jgi:hypothetical protein
VLLRISIRLPTATDALRKDVNVIEDGFGGKSGMTNLRTEADLEIELAQIYQKWEALGYRASRFYQMFMRHCKRYKGGIAAVRDVVSKSGTGGFEKLAKLDRLDLTLEKAIVLNRDWTHLFSSNLCIIAQRKIDAVSK